MELMTENTLYGVLHAATGIQNIILEHLQLLRELATLNILQNGFTQTKCSGKRA